MLENPYLEKKGQQSLIATFDNFLSHAYSAPSDV